MRKWVRQLQKASHLKEKVPVQVHIGVEKNLLILYLLTKVVPPSSLRIAMVKEMGEMDETMGQVVLMNITNMMRKMPFL